jgi:sigma-54 dependent transcriptional regulator, flagellar regulatory protein
MIRAHRWPGNVRELCHFVERTVLLTQGGPITAADLRLPSAPAPTGRATTSASSYFGLAEGSNVTARALLSHALDLPAAALTVAPTRRSQTPTGESESLDLRSAVETLERQLINHALDVAGGNRTEAAALLGLNRTTLVEKLRKYGV